MRYPICGGSYSERSAKVQYSSKVLMMSALPLSLVRMLKQW